jgi:hypothetical protein
MNKCIAFLHSIKKGCTVIRILLLIFMSTTYIVTFTIYLCSTGFPSITATFCFANPDYRLIRIISTPQSIRIIEGLL